MERVPEVRQGAWVNHEQNKLQYTVLEKYYIAVQLVVGALLAIAWPFLSDILTRLLHWLQYGWHRLHQAQAQRLGSPPSTGEAASLISGTRPPANYSSIARPGDLSSPSRTASGLGDPPASQDTTAPDSTTHDASAANTQNGGYLDNQTSAPVNGVNGACNQEMSGETSKKTSRSWLSMTLSLLLILAAVAFSVAASFAAPMPADSSGLSASANCAWWELKEGSRKEAMDNDDLVQARKERRAAQYGRDCYGHHAIANPDQCKFFATPTIPYVVETRQACPFRDDKLCPGEGSIAVKFSTGRVDASVLGINSPKPPKFSRTTICVPLDVNRGFVHQIPPDNTYSEDRYRYFLGPKNGSSQSYEYTYEMFGDPFKWDVAAYSVSVYEAGPDRDDYWVPIQGLDVNHPGRNFLTIMFISTCRIIYRGLSADWIFHVTDAYPRRRDTWWNRDPRARPLTCIDWSEVCTADEDCSPTHEPHPERGSAYEFTREALNKSTTFAAIQFQLGKALVAQDSVGDFESLQLSQEQWIIESKALFNTSLARIQFDALDIAIGVGRDGELDAPYESKTPAWANLCGIYRFQLPKGYANINIGATAGLISGVLALYVLAQDTVFGHTEFGGHSMKFSKDKKDQFHGNWMLFDLLIWATLHYGLVCAQYIVRIGRSIAHSAMEKLRSRRRAPGTPETLG